MPEAVVAEAIEDVLRDRHTRETSELLSRQYNERADTLRMKLEDVFDKLRADKTDTELRMQVRCFVGVWVVVQRCRRV